MLTVPQLGWSRKAFSMPCGGIGALGITSQQITSTAGGSIMAAAGPIAAINPIAGAIVAGVGALTSLIGNLFQPDLTKEAATAIVNQLEAEHLKPNLERWQAAPDWQKTPEAQAAALSVFDQTWAAVIQGCSNPALKTAGVNCITDRQQGSCHWTADGQTPGVPPDCGNWFIWYRDPIANDPAVAANVAAASASASAAGSSASATAGGTQTSTSAGSTASSSQGMLYGGLALVGIALFLAFAGGD